MPLPPLPAKKIEVIDKEVVEKLGKKLEGKIKYARELARDNVSLSLVMELSDRLGELEKGLKIFSRDLAKLRSEVKPKAKAKKGKRK